MKTLVVYYSNSGSNKYLAEKIARALKCDSEAIKPRLNFFPFLILFSLTKTSVGIKRLSRNVAEFDRIIVCCPIWMGQIISPLRDFIGRYHTSINKLCLASCCGSSDAAKDVKFGYAGVFRKVKDMLGDKCVLCEAFPVGLVLAEDKKGDGNAMMKARLSDDNFTGEIQKRLDDFIQRIDKVD